MSKVQTSSPRVILAFAAIYIIWGTTYLTVRIGIATIPSFMMGAMRYCLAAVIFFGYALIKKESLSGKYILQNIIIGLIMQTGGQAILFWCEKYISSGLTAILVAAEPIWFVLLDKPKWKLYFNNKRILTGVAAGFAGIIVLFGNLLREPSLPGTAASIQFVAAITALCSGAVWAGGSLFFAYAKREGSLQVNLGWQLTGGIIGCILVSLLTREYDGFVWQQVSWQSYAAVVYLAVAGSVIAFTCYNWLLTKKPAAIVGTYAYINPVIAVIAGSLLANERLFINQIAGMIIILMAAWLINKAESAMKLR